MVQLQVQDAAAWSAWCGTAGEGGCSWCDACYLQIFAEQYLYHVFLAQNQGCWIDYVDSFVQQTSFVRLFCAANIIFYQPDSFPFYTVWLYVCGFQVTTVFNTTFAFPKHGWTCARDRLRNRWSGAPWHRLCVFRLRFSCVSSTVSTAKPQRCGCAAGEGSGSSAAERPGKILAMGLKWGTVDIQDP